MILILFTLLILIHQIPQTNSKEYEFNSTLYDFNGTCEENYYCLPFANISFSHIWENSKQDDIIQELNSEVKKCPEIQQQVIFKQSHVKSNEIGIFAEKDINFNATIGSFTPNNSLTSEIDLSAFEGKDYYEQYKQFPSLNFTKDKIGSSFRIIFNLLFHAYHFEDSTLQLMFKAWPSKPNTPLFTLSIYEWKLLKPDRAFREIAQSRQNLMKIYSHFIYLLNETWTEEQRQIIFNGRDQVILDDFIYAYFIYLTRSVTLQSGEQEFFTSIAPFVNHMQRYRDDLLSGKKQTLYFKSENQMVRYNANDFFEADDEIYIDIISFDNFFYYIMFGYYYSSNPSDCFFLDFMSQKNAKANNLKQSECVNAKHVALKKYYLTCNLLNMEEKDQLDCQSKIKEITEDDAQKIKIMFQKCVHPQWSKDEFEEIQVKLPQLNKKAQKEYMKKIGSQKKQGRKKVKKQDLEEQIMEEMNAKEEYTMEDIEDFEEQLILKAEVQETVEEEIHSEL